MIPHATQKYNSLFRQLLFLGVLILLGASVFLQLKFFVGSLLGAVTLYIVFRRMYFWLVERHNWIPWIASLTIVFVNALLLSALGFVFFKLVANELTDIDPQQIMNSINGLVGQINDMVGFNAVPENILQQSEGFVGTLVTGIFNTTYSFGANVVMMLIIVYFMFTGGRRMERNLLRYAPFRETSLDLLTSEVKNMVYSNAVLMPLILVAQTIVSVFIYWILGIESALFWGFLTALCGLIPVVGTMIVYIPFAVYMVANGQLWNGIILFSYGSIVISNTDNLIRILTMRSVADTHPLIVIFGVILGIPMFGFWGIIFGPLLLSALILLIKIYYVEYGLMNKLPDEEGQDAGPPKRKVPRHLRKFANKAEELEGRWRNRANQRNMSSDS